MRAKPIAKILNLQARIFAKDMHNKQHLICYYRRKAMTNRLQQANMKIAAITLFAVFFVVGFITSVNWAVQAVLRYI